MPGHPAEALPGDSPRGHAALLAERPLPPREPPPQTLPMASGVAPMGFLLFYFKKPIQAELKKLKLSSDPQEHHRTGALKREWLAVVLGSKRTCLGTESVHQRVSFPREEFIWEANSRRTRREKPELNGNSETVKDNADVRHPERCYKGTIT